IDLPFPPAGVAATDAGVWITETGGPGLARVGAATGKIAARLSVTERAGQGAPAGSEISDGAIGAIAAGAGSLWLARGASVLRVDPGSGRVRARFATPIAADLV